mmetsp:Transcript_2149/g.3962  ORF Transcript_2149/g.3962 Transcript_2149/m.3962 type:complete len:230 (+) Transcript_2149:620-1309(+)
MFSLFSISIKVDSTHARRPVYLSLKLNRMKYIFPFSSTDSGTMPPPKHAFNSADADSGTCKLPRNSVVSDIIGGANPNTFRTFECTPSAPTIKSALSSKPLLKVTFASFSLSSISTNFSPQYNSILSRSFTNLRSASRISHQTNTNVSPQGGFIPTCRMYSINSGDSSSQANCPFFPIPKVAPRFSKEACFSTRNTFLQTLDRPKALANPDGPAPITMLVTPCCSAMTL